MTPILQIALAFGSVLVLIGLMGLVRAGARRYDLGPEVQRKLVHVGTGLYAIGLPWVFAENWPVYMLIGLTLAVMAALRLPRFSSGLGAALHGVERRSYGDFLLAGAVALCLFLSGGDPLLYVLPLALVTLADAAAALVGTSYGRRRFAVEQGYKSLEGTVAFFVLALLIALLCLMFLSDLPDLPVLILALMVAGFGTLVEAQSWRGFDNLFLPLGVLVFLGVHGSSSIPELLGLTALFLLSIVFFRGIGDRFGLTPHAARVHVVAMFLIVAVSDVQNALLPGLALLAHALASQIAPDQDDFGELDIVAALGLISFGWLGLGEALGWNALGFYGCTAMGLAMGFGTLALQRWIWAVPLLAAALFAMRLTVVGWNPVFTEWAEPLHLLALIVLTATSLPALIARDWLRRGRVAKLALLAGLPPLIWYLLAVFWQDAPAIINGAAS